MKSKFTRSAAVLAAVLAGTTAARAAEPASVPADVEAQLRELRAKIDRLEQQQKQDADDAYKAVVEDARNRSSLAVDTTEITSGFDRGFFIQSPDKTFTLRPGFSVQVRNVTNWRENVEADGDSDLQNGWEIRRLKLSARGNAYGPNVTYGIQLTNTRNSGGIELDDIWLQYAFAQHFAIKAGQYKGPFSREELISDPTGLLVERSLLNEVLGGGLTGPRSQGASLIAGFGGKGLKDDPLRTEIMIHDGDGTPNTDFRDDIIVAGSDTRPDYGVIGRVDYKVFGNWSDWNKISGKGNKEDLLVIGGGVAVSGNTGANVYRGTVDVQYQGLDGRLGLFAAVIGRLTDIRTDAVGAEDEATDWGAIVQAGYLVAPAWEPFVRADFVRFDDDFAVAGGGGEDTFPEFAVGVNHYLGKDGQAFNHAKIQVDLNYYPNGVPGDRTGIGALSSGGENEIVLRAQLSFWL